MSDFSRGVRLTYPDGTQLDGAQFPNGMVVTCHREAGLCSGAVTLDDLLEDAAGVRVEWADPAEGSSS